MAYYVANNLIGVKMFDKGIVFAVSIIWGFAKFKEFTLDRPLVPDLEFSDLELLENLVTGRVNFVILLKEKPNFCERKCKPIRYL
jgi:hypothetical protein